MAIHRHDRIMHPFYGMLERLLVEAGFDAFVAGLTASGQTAAAVSPYAIGPGAYFRMLLVGYFEGIDSQRGIAWRCGDSRSLREFVGCPFGDTMPDAASLAEMGRRLPAEVHARVFAFVLKLVEENKLFQAHVLLAAEADYLEANAAMRSIQRQDALGEYHTFLLHLAQEGAIENPLRDRPRTDNPHVVVSKRILAGAPAFPSGQVRAEKSEHVVSRELLAGRAQTYVPQHLGEPTVPNIARPGAEYEPARHSLELGWNLGDIPRTVFGCFLIVCAVLSLLPLLTEVQTGKALVFVAVNLVLLGIGCYYLLLAGKDGWPITPWDD